MTVFCFLVATIHWSAEIAAIVIIVRTDFVESLDLSLADKAAYTNLRAQKSNGIIIWTELKLVRSSIEFVSLAYIFFLLFSPGDQ